MFIITSLAKGLYFTLCLLKRFYKYSRSSARSIKHFCSASFSL